MIADIVWIVYTVETMFHYLLAFSALDVDRFCINVEKTEKVLYVKVS